VKLHSLKQRWYSVEVLLLKI